MTAEDRRRPADVRRPDHTVEQIAQTLGVTRGTVYAHLNHTAA